MTFKCIYCNYVVDDISKMGKHYETFHRDLIPEDMTPNQFAYYTKTGKTHGRCTECGRDTKWNPKTNKYHRLCERKACRKAVADRADARNVISHGKAKLLDSREHQEKMLYRRKISGEYKWSTGDVVFKYVGTYELDFLKFMDLKMSWDPADLLAPAPQTFEYQFNGKTHFYIPDAFIPSINTFIEIKDGDPTNPNHHANMHPDIIAVNRVKERLKDEAMKSLKGSHYIKIYNKEYDGFIKFLNQQSNIITESANMFEVDEWWKQKWSPSAFDYFNQKTAFKYILKKYRETVLDMIEEWDEYVKLQKLQKLTIASKKHNTKIINIFKDRIINRHKAIIEDIGSDEFKYTLAKSRSNPPEKMITPNNNLIPDILWDFSVKLALIDTPEEIDRNNSNTTWTELVGELKITTDAIPNAMIKAMKKVIPAYMDIPNRKPEQEGSTTNVEFDLYTLPKDD